MVVPVAAAVNHLLGAAVRPAARIAEPSSSSARRADASMKLGAGFGPRQLDAHLRARRGRGATGRGGDRPHDRQPESGTGAATARITAAEALECMREELRRKALPLVADKQRSETIIGARREPHGARTMAQRVVDEIAERLLESNPVSA